MLKIRFTRISELSKVYLFQVIIQVLFCSLIIVIAVTVGSDFCIQKNYSSWGDFPLCWRFSRLLTLEKHSRMVEKLSWLILVGRFYISSVFAYTLYSHPSQLLLPSLKPEVYTFLASVSNLPRRSTLSSNQEIPNRCHRRGVTGSHDHSESIRHYIFPRRPGASVTA